MLIGLILFVVVLGAGAWAFYKVPWFNKMCRDSETVAVQIGKIVAGGVATILTAVDQGQLQDATHAVVTYFHADTLWPVYLLGLGIIMLAVNRFRQKA